MLSEIAESLLTTEWGRRASLGALIAAGIWAFFLLVEVPVQWYGDIKIVRGSHTSMKSVSPDHAAQRIAQLPEAHLFGESASLSDVPVTSLPLHLVGVIKAEEEDFSRVIISESGQPSKIYRVGDSISDGVIIHSIIPDGVIVENGKRLEKLPLQRPPLQFQGMPKPLLPDENTQEE